MFERLRAWFKLNTAAPFVPDGMRHYCLPTPEGRRFEHGVELLGDDSTPMPFVMRVLQEEARLLHRDAAVAVALCQETGAVILPMRSREDAVETATRVAARARRESWPLACRPVSAQGSSEAESSSIEG